MKNKAIPITALRDTSAIDELVNQSDSPIIVTKNGYEDFTIVPKTLDNQSNEYLSIEPNNNFGFYRLKCCDLQTESNDVKGNAKKIIESINKSIKEGVDLLAFPELSLIGKSSLDYFNLQDVQNNVSKALDEIVKTSAKSQIIIILGCPIKYCNSLLNCAVVIQNGKILAIKVSSKNTIFKDSNNLNVYQYINICNQKVLISNNIVFKSLNDNNLKFVVEIGEELKTNFNDFYKSENISLIINLGGFAVNNFNDEYLKTLIKAKSEIFNCAYAYCDTSFTENSIGSIYGSHHIIYEQGLNLVENIEFDKKDILMDIDYDLVSSKHSTGLRNINQINHYNVIWFAQNIKKKKELKRIINAHPFIPNNKEVDLDYVKRVIKIQSIGLANRLRKIKCYKAIIGLSGGLDSALALIVTIESFKLLKIKNSNIYTFSLPCFGTTSKTKTNSEKLAKLCGTTFKEINIGESVEQHLHDLDISNDDRSIAFENAQARERTQYLMDYANLIGGIVIGTGDLSELALGWCTYNGDHMSMYDPNANIAKTLVKYLVNGYGLMNPSLKDVLEDILKTPISPELLPGKQNSISQLTEDKIGPYELQDFYIYNFVKYKFSAAKLLYLAKIAFNGLYSEEELEKWLNVLMNRYFNNQFKRNVSPDFPLVCDIDISPNGDLKLPSDIGIGTLLEKD